MSRRYTVGQKCPKVPEFKFEAVPGLKTVENGQFFSYIAFPNRKGVTSAGLMLRIFKIRFESILGPFFAQKWPILAQNGPFWPIFGFPGLKFA